LGPANSANKKRKKKVKKLAGDGGLVGDKMGAKKEEQGFNFHTRKKGQNMKLIKGMERGFLTLI